MRLAELWGRAVDRVMPDRYRDDRWADQARAQWERGEPPVGQVETMWYGLFEQEKGAALEADRDTGQSTADMVRQAEGEAAEEASRERQAMGIPAMGEGLSQAEAANLERGAAERREWDAAAERAEHEAETGGEQPQAQSELGQLIDQAAEQFPEYSELDKLQEAIYEEAHERGPAMSYPEYEGPGFTEPAVNGPENHVDHTEYERDHYWDTELHGKEGGTWEMTDEEINAMALPFEEAEPPENDGPRTESRYSEEFPEFDPDGNPRNDRDPDAGQYEDTGPQGYGPHDDTWSYDDRTPAERERDNAAGEAVAARHLAEAEVRQAHRDIENAAKGLDPFGGETSKADAGRWAGEAREVLDKADAAEFETYYGEPPTPAAEIREQEHNRQLQTGMAEREGGQ